MVVIGVRYSFRKLVSSVAENPSEIVVNDRKSQNIRSDAVEARPVSGSQDARPIARQPRVRHSGRMPNGFPRPDAASGCRATESPSERPSPEDRLGTTGSSKTPFLVNANQLAPNRITHAMAPNSALQRRRNQRATVKMNASDRIAANNEFRARRPIRPAVSVAPDRICSRSCASATTPGVEGSSGVATTSDSNEALAPTTTILPWRSADRRRPRRFSRPGSTAGVRGREIRANVACGLRFHVDIADAYFGNARGSGEAALTVGV